MSKVFAAVAAWFAKWAVVEVETVEVDVWFEAVAA